ncbi:MAG TPA: transcriptional repressor [Caulobacteraceae bacterium]|jgi:Fur family zinc uptake transcriptional regulator
MGSEHAGHRHEPLGLSGRALAIGLRSAEARCLAHGQKLTPARRRVLELLMQAGQPVKAYDLISAFGEDKTAAGGAPAKPPTVYRALEFLEREGLAHRIESLAAYVACTAEPGVHAAAFLLCDCCGRTEEIAAPVDEALRDLAAAAGYTIQSVAIEAHGRCAACRDPEA